MANALRDGDMRCFLETHITANLATLIECWQAPNPTLASLAVGLSEAAERLCANVSDSNGAGDRGSGALVIWDGADGQIARNLLLSLATEGHDSAIDVGDMPQIMRQLLDEEMVHPHSMQPRLAILGAVEARMHPAQVVRAHRLILAGFNEGIGHHVLMPTLG